MLCLVSSGTGTGGLGFCSDPCVLVAHSSVGRSVWWYKSETSCGECYLYAYLGDNSWMRSFYAYTRSSW